VTNMTSAVSDGVVQIGDDGFYHGSFPWGGAIRLPMLVQTEAEFVQAQQIIRPYLEAAYLKKGVILLAQYAYPAQVGFSRRKLASLEDYKGQKLRVSSAEQGEFVRTFGGVPVTLGTPEVPSSLDRGVIDGVFTSAAPGGWSWRESLKFNYRLVIGFFDSNLIVNKAAFDKLSPGMQQRLRSIVTETAPNLSAVMKRDDDATIDQLKSVMTVTMSADEEVKRATAAMSPYWDSWARSKGPEAVEIVGKLRAAFKR
jgi:TRAP-type C4-dicarboxylate transport system substrate-binding protein